MSDTPDGLPEAPENFSWVERVFRPDIGFKERLKFTAKNVLPASGGLIGNKILRSSDKEFNR